MFLLDHTSKIKYTYDSELSIKLNKDTIMHNVPFGNIAYVFLTAVEEVFISGIWGSWGMMDRILNV